MFLEIKNLSKKYYHTEALKEVSFIAEEREIICILGPSGCGKTTLLQALGGFIDINGGQIILDGEELQIKDPEERPVATVFQSYGLFPHKTVIDNIIYGLKFKGYRKKEALIEGRKMIETLNLMGYENKKVTELSGGEQQRVALGRALIMKPKLLLLDEPFSNLDTKLKVSMRDELLRIRDVFGITMVFVTHDQEDAFSISDRIILMNKGQIEQIDRAKELYLNPKTKFALNFIGSANIFGDKYIRPENIEINKNGKEAIIEGKTFKGFYIEYEISFQGKSYKKIVLNSEKEYDIGDKILVEMEMKKI